ncbi:MAG: hypothetical protein K6E98_12260 [Lachnospiraceae bacterium]|nr:hypothetical protein [Lachnospiraceae bacterium]
MKKRIMSAVVSAMLVVSMAVTAMAGSTSGSNAATSANSSATTPSGETINDALANSLAADVASDGGENGTLPANEVIAYSNFVKATLPGVPAKIVAAAKCQVKDDLWTTSSKKYVNGQAYFVYFRMPNGNVIVKPVTCVKNTITIKDAPKGAVSFAVVAITKAP